jgi:hypothetical protein
VQAKNGSLTKAYSDAEIANPVVGFTYYNLTTAALRVCTVSIPCTWAAVGGGGTPALSQATLGGAPSSAYTFFPATSSACTTYSASGTNFCSVNNATGAVTTNTDAGVLINAALAAATGGTLYFKNGVYNLNSFTNESATGCSTFTSDSKPLAWAIGIPNSAGGLATEFEWHFIGESGSPHEGESNSSSPNTNGVIFNVTASAISGATSGAFLVNTFQRPGSSGCTLTSGTGVGFGNVSNEDYFQNITFRFPTNQRGNECGLCLWFAAEQGKDTVTADFNLSSNSIATGSAPVAGTYGSFGMSTTVSRSGNWQTDRNTWAIGYNICYDWLSEELTVEHSNAIYCNYSAEIGRAQTNPVLHPILIKYFTDQENLHGILFGPNMTQGGRVDIFDLDFEYGIAATWYARSTANMVETNPGYTSGIITFSEFSNATGTITTQSPTPSLFTTGGQNFVSYSAVTNPDIAPSPATVNFTTLPISSNTWGPAWLPNQSSLSCAITSASGGTVISSGSTSCIQHYVGQTVNNAQFAISTVKAVTSAGQIAAITNASTAASVNFYYYGCSTSGSGVQAKRTIYKAVAGVYTSLATTAANSGCVANDVLELDSIPTLAGTTLLNAYYNGVLDLSIVDSTYTTGYPGAYVSADTGTGLLSWTGGSLPTKTSADTIYSKPMYAPTYNTLTKCAASGTSAAASLVACGTSSAGLFSVPITTPTSAIVSTTAVTANSTVWVHQRLDTAAGTALGVTCNATTNTTFPNISALTAGTSFTIPMAAFTTNPGCYEYWIVN